MKIKVYYLLILIALLFVGNDLNSQNFNVEVTARIVPQINCSSELVSAGYYITDNNVVGIGIGKVNTNYRFYLAYTLYYRHYIRLGTSRVSFAFDFFAGAGRCYKEHISRRSKSKTHIGDWETSFSFQPTVNIGLGKKRRTKFFIGRSFGPSLGITLGASFSL